MFKVLTACIMVTLMFSTSVFALGGMQTGTIGQTQGFDIYGENMASQIGGHATSVAGNMTSIDQKNTLLTMCGPTLTQKEGSMLTQCANTSGTCGSLRVDQIGGSSGSQCQLLGNLGCFSFKTQGQTLEVGLQESATKDGGTGSAEGAQGSLATQCQTILSGRTIMTSTQTIGAAQTANVTGNKWSDGAAGNLITVTATQTQMSN
jgi:hypothetical protein